MAVISVRFSAQEKKMLQHMTESLDIDQSTLIKRSVLDMFEDLLDRQVIEDFEGKEKQGKIKFYKFEKLFS